VAAQLPQSQPKEASGQVVMGEAYSPKVRNTDEGEEEDG